MMSDMRTTLTLDDDLAGLLKQRAEALGVPFKEASIALSALAWVNGIGPTAPCAEDHAAFLRVQAGH